MPHWRLQRARNAPIGGQVDARQDVGEQPLVFCYDNSKGGDMSEDNIIELKKSTSLTDTGRPSIVIAPKCNHCNFTIETSTETVRCNICNERVTAFFALNRLAEAEGKFMRDMRQWKCDRENIKLLREELRNRHRVKCQHCKRMTEIPRAKIRPIHPAYEPEGKVEK